MAQEPATKNQTFGSFFLSVCKQCVSGICFCFTRAVFVWHRTNIGRRGEEGRQVSLSLTGLSELWRVGYILHTEKESNRNERAIQDTFQTYDIWNQLSGLKKQQKKHKECTLFGQILEFLSKKRNLYDVWNSHKHKDGNSLDARHLTRRWKKQKNNRNTHLWLMTIEPPETIEFPQREWRMLSTPREYYEVIIAAVPHTHSWNYRTKLYRMHLMIRFETEWAPTNRRRWPRLICWSTTILAYLRPVVGAHLDHSWSAYYCQSSGGKRGQQRYPKTDVTESNGWQATSGGGLPLCPVCAILGPQDIAWNI